MKQSPMTQYVKKLVLSAMFLALGLVLPFLTGQIPQIGNMMLPMHLPLLRHALFLMPPMPGCIAMAFEMAAYGTVVGFLYAHARWQCVISLYRCLLAAMLAGRLVWAAVRVVMTGVASVPFTWQIFVTEAFITAIPGIVLQLMVIPAVMVAMDRTGLVRFRKSRAKEFPSG